MVGVGLGDGPDDGRVFARLNGGVLGGQRFQLGHGVLEFFELVLPEGVLRWGQRLVLALHKEGAVGVEPPSTSSLLLLVWGRRRGFIRPSHRGDGHAGSQR